MAENKEDKSSAKKGKKKVDIVKEVKKSPWVFSTVILVVLILIVLAGNFGNCVTGKTISAEEAGSRIEQFASSNGDEISVKGVEEEAGLYKVLLDVQGQETSVFVTKDGENLIPTGAVQSLELEEDSQENEGDSDQEASGNYAEFSQCLSEEGVVIYGMETCPHCQDLVETLGGEEAVEPVYVECTEDQQKCQEEMSGTGVPEIQINGEMYEGERSIESLSEATGCEFQEDSNVEASSDEDTEKTDEESESISECAESYGADENKILFYYSDSCEWCSKMKPGVEKLEEEDYDISQIESSGNETDIIDDCVREHMESNGVPQFICVGTGEIKTGAFVDENNDLDQEALDEWASNCVSK